MGGGLWWVNHAEALSPDDAARLDERKRKQQNRL